MSVQIGVKKIFCFVNTYKNCKVLQMLAGMHLVYLWRFRLTLILSIPT